jgi:DNA-binding NtrC family response regulator
MATLRVLVLDDEPIVGQRLRSILSKLGCEIEVHDRPNEAFIRMFEKRFDVVISDIVMDELDGLHLLEYWKRHCCKTKIILITGYPNEEVVRRAKQHGAFDFLAKPFDPEQLRAAVVRAAAALGIPLDYKAGTVDEAQGSP